MASKTEPLEELYLQWLYEEYVGYSDEEPDITHWHLCAHLQRIPYRWSIPNDDNRAEDGVFLRETFIAKHPQYREDVTIDFMRQDCSVFEFLIAVAERAEFESMKPQMWWFHEMLYNLRLLELNDYVFKRDRRRCLEITDTVVKILLDREYSWDGHGGLFPLEAPPVDQRTAEVWYQMSTYILEKQ